VDDYAAIMYAFAMSETVFFTCDGCGELKPQNERRLVPKGVMKARAVGGAANVISSVLLCANCLTSPKHADPFKRGNLSGAAAS
jgi:hypothetical protein